MKHTEKQQENCYCYQIEKEIRKKFPSCNWNCDSACKEWNRRKSELKDNNIHFEAGSDDLYGCTCPTCGRFICGWCV